MDWTVRSVGRSAGNRADGGLRATGDEDKALGVMLKSALGIFCFLPADPVVDSAEGADWVAVVADSMGAIRMLERRMLSMLMPMSGSKP